MPTLLARCIDSIQTYEAAVVLEYKTRQFKRDAAMLSLVPSIFLLIPLVSHIVYTDRIRWGREDARRK
jgi:hypothetical protein